MAVEEVGAEGELFGKLAGEELLEGRLRLARRRAGERRPDRSGEELHQLRLQRRDRAAGDEPLGRPDAIEDADHVVGEPEDRRGHAGLDVHQARPRPGAGQRIEIVEERLPLIDDRLEEGLAVTDRRPIRLDATPGDRPLLARAEEHEAQVEADKIDEGPGRGVVKLPRLARDLLDLDDSFEPRTDS